MTDRVAFITGASRGIGRAIAEGLAKEKWSVAVCARSEAGMQELADSIEAPYRGNAKFLAFPLDIGDTTAVETAVDATVRELGRIDLLVNNAGINFEGTLELTPDQFDEIMRTNVKGAWNTARAIVPTMRKQGSGCIVNISSVAGKTGFPGRGGYCASKFALNGLTESLFRELTPHGIKVTSICPSWTESEMSRSYSFAPDEMIATSDILSTILYLMELGPNACIKDIDVLCKADFCD